MSQTQKAEPHPTLSNSEWLSRFLGKLNVTPIQASLLTFGLSLLIYLTAAFAFDAWLPSSESRGLSGDSTAWLINSIFQPMVIGYFVWLQYAPRKLIEGLTADGILRTNVYYKSVAATWNKRLKSKWLVVTAVVIGVVFTLVLVIGTWLFPNPRGGWLGSKVGLALAVAPFIFIITYAFVIDLLDIAAAILGVNKLLRDPNVKIRPFSPDLAGGLGQIGRFAANLGYGIAIAGVIISMGIIQSPTGLRDPFIIFLVVLYLLLAPAVFYLPLRNAHHAMKNHRDAMATNVSNEIDLLLEQYNSADPASDQTNTKELREQIEELSATHKMIMGFPIWPFNVESTRKFAGLVLSPLIPGLISVTIEILTT